jgi:hypothetical protein
MRKHLIWTLALATAIAVAVAGVATAAKVTVRAGNMVLTYDAKVLPKKLPTNKPAPISLDLKGTIAAIDGGHPPALKTVVVDTDKNGFVNVKGLPACTSGRLQAQSTANARKACPKAIVSTGGGRTTVRVAFPDSTPFTATGPLTFFNGGKKGGTTTLFVHAYVAVPTPTAIVTTVKIKKRRSGPFGLRSVATVPVIAGGSGSVLSYQFTIKRSFKYKGKKQSYLTAKCPTGRFYGRGESRFADGSKLTGQVVVPCTRKG